MVTWSSWTRSTTRNCVLESMQLFGSTHPNSFERVFDKSHRGAAPADRAREGHGRRDRITLNLSLIVKDTTSRNTCGASARASAEAPGMALSWP